MLRLKGRTGGSRNQRRGPLRKIVEVLRHGEGMFDQNRVKLECGHVCSSNGVYKARCAECAKTAIAEVL